MNPASAQQLLLSANLSAQAMLFLGVIWSIAVPGRRIYPMERRGVAFWGMWLLFGYVFASNGALVILDWDSGPWHGPLRYALGLPVSALGGALVTWGVVTLGAKNTSAVRDGLVARGPYLMSRNPQYVGDFLLFVGISIVANSEVVWVTHLLAAGVLLLAPFAEEPWLVKQYGDAYVAYRRRVPRYL